MKASLRLRENQNPIVKAKIPLNTLGFPFRSSIETSTSDAKDRDLCLSFSTFFQSGPVLKLFYRPNDSDRAFGLVVKTGVGSLGSPPLTMSAEFNFLRNGNPSFFLQFKPQLGDFSIRRSIGSKKIENDDVQSDNIVPKDEKVAEKKTGKGTWADLFVADGLFGGEVHARTVIPIVDKVVGKIGWSLKFPATESDSPMGKMPYMVVNKLGIEHVWKDKAGIYRNSRGNDGGDVAKACLALKKKLGNVELEKERLRKELEEMKSEISAGKLVPAAGGRKVTRLRRMIERLKSRKANRSGEIKKNGAVNFV